MILRKSMRKSWLLILGIGAFAAGFNSANVAIARGHAGSEKAPGQMPVPSTPVHDDGKICHGGPSQAVTSEIIVRSLSSDQDGCTMEVDLEVRNTTERERRAISVLELVDDRGNEVAPAQLVPVVELTDQVSVSGGYLIPSGLTPGYYKLTARTVSAESANGEQEAVMASLFVRVDDTGIVPISNDDWHMQSNANEAFQLTDEEQ